MAAKTTIDARSTLECRLAQCKGIASMVADAHEQEDDGGTRDAMWALQTLLEQAEDAFRQMCAAGSKTTK